jgi:diguanylate cyclase
MSLWLIGIGVALGVVQLVAGVMIGRCLTTRATSTAAGSRRLEQSMRQLFGLIGSVAGDVDKHQAQIRQANHDLSTIGPDDENLSSLVLATVARIVDVNEGLRTRLGDAEQQLQDQAVQLERHFTAAMTDPLTRLANRRAFDEELARRLADRQHKNISFCLLMVDVDYFKSLNDHFGHPMGDEVLRRMGQVLTGALGNLDTVARIGGEEFAVVLPRTHLVEASEIADRLRRAVAETMFTPELAHLKITISLGVSEAAANDDAATLMKRADEALYASKRGGRNCGHYHDGLACRRISIAEDAGLARLQTPPVEQAADDPRELLELCGGVRSRLAEVTGEAGKQE